MKRLITALLLCAAALAQDKAKKPMLPTNPILSVSQQMQLSATYTELQLAYKKLNALPEFKEAMRLQQKLATLELQFCQSHDGKTYHLENASGMWACRETTGGKQ